MDAQQATKTDGETRVSPWVAFGHHGYSHYRLWRLFDGFRWFDRHEWKQDNGATHLTGWLNDRTPGWPAHYTPADIEAA